MEKQRETSGKRTSSRSSAMEEPPRNIAGRILDSASGLLRDTLSPSSAQQASILANVLASEGKAGPSTASACTERDTVSELCEGPIARQGPATLPGTNAAFREPGLVNGSINPRSTTTSSGMSLDQFLLSAQHNNEIPTWQHSPTAKGKQIASSLNIYHAEPEASYAEMSAAWDSNARNDHTQALPTNNNMNIHRTNAVHETAVVNEADGGEVVKLLQDPNPLLWMDMPEEQEIAYTMSAEDMRVAEEIVRSIDTALPSKPAYTSAISAASRGEPFPRFSSFFDDTENYQDEVWGYLRPLVEEAKQEHFLSSSPDEEEGPATRRLRMILAHVDGSG